MNITRQTRLLCQRNSSRISLLVEIELKDRQSIMTIKNLLVTSSRHVASQFSNFYD